MSNNINVLSSGYVAPDNNKEMERIDTKFVPPKSIDQRHLSDTIQNDIDAKAPIASPTFTGTVTIPSPFTLGSTSVTTSGTELNYVDGVTGAIQTQLASGWIPATGTWSYNAADKITVPSGAGSIYQKGDRIKFTQTTVKYGVIVAVTDTLLTIAVNTDYTVANAAITDIYYSHQVNPIGYPATFNYTPTLTNITLGNGTLAFVYSVVEGWVTVLGKFTFGSTSSISGSMIFSLPITGTTAHNTFYQTLGQIEDNGTTEYMANLTQESTTTVSVGAITTSGSYAQRANTSSTVPMVWATNDAFRVIFSYFMA